MKFVIFILMILNLSFGNELQKAIDSANSGDIIELGNGLYKGSIMINKPLSIIGVGKNVVIDGGGNGSVISVNSPYVKIQNLIIQNSGNLATNIDSAINVKESHNLDISSNIIRDTLFGISFEKTNESKIYNNQISSKNVPMAVMGDSIRLWYSHSNDIYDNNISNSRDMVLWYSSGNNILRNHGKNCRYSLHFMYSGENLVEDNIFENNIVGIFFMFSEGSIVRNNTIRNSIGSFGVGIGMKDTSDFKLYNNKVVYNARGFYLDQSPFQPGKINYYEGNEILYNTVGIQLHATQHKSVFKNNIFKGNMEIVFNDTPESKINLNEWNGNYFDEYDGLDLNKDGYGDIPYSHYVYADKLWQSNPNLRFFYGSSVISILNLLAKLAPFSQPELLLTDDKPKMEPVL
ncbi:MAG: nitrous oxide reductase family maturation protein NosD [Campylobacter sputorum]|uniref:nitrous oxide reductase family maturation protein NosD n=1 Tax=Campylobacter sputorum TaxID=206 RepID=UPI001F1FEAF8|nr:nitrous oxide reductase family maturation protein NosD [Campylobacter sputorum]ASM38094.1 copper ABC transporter NosDFY, periplasmic copper-binding protein NosD [Campylobacter sputorum bv. paraureolyticus LMG 11764]MDY6121242.1 nitrous oxide reductase family maturation protein NosD [Campylobacter sputorum]